MSNLLSGYRLSLGNRTILAHLADATGMFCGQRSQLLENQLVRCEHKSLTVTALLELLRSSADVSRDERVLVRLAGCDMRPHDAAADMSTVELFVSFRSLRAKCAISRSDTIVVECTLLRVQRSIRSRAHRCRAAGLCCLWSLGSEYDMNFRG
jgi:hypothetical protein